MNAFHNNPYRQKKSSKKRFQACLLWLWRMHFMCCYTCNHDMNELERDTWRKTVCKSFWRDEREHFNAERSTLSPLCQISLQSRQPSLRLNASKLQQLRFHFKTDFFFPRQWLLLHIIILWVREVIARETILFFLKGDTKGLNIF